MATSLCTGNLWFLPWLRCIGMAANARRLGLIRCVRSGWFRSALGLILLADAHATSAESAPTVDWSFRCGSRIYSSAVVADLSASPGLEILTASSAERKLHCLSAAGKVLWTYGGFTLRMTSTPTVADLDGDGKPEILIATRAKGVICLAADGALLWKWAVKGGIPWGSVTVADTDLDGDPEIYWISMAGRVERRSPDGGVGWAVQLPSGGSRGPLAIGDVDGDGRGEIVTGGSAAVHCFDSAGNERWRYQGMASFEAGPVLADVNGDGRAEVLAASTDGVLYCLMGKSGDVFWNHRTFRGRIDTTLAVGDLTGNGIPEIVYGDFFGNLYCLDGNGEEHWSFRAGDWIESAPALGDVDGDGEAELVFGSADGNVYCLSARGDLEWTFMTHKRISASPTLCDVDDDGAVEILIGSHSGVLYCLSAGGPWDPARVLWPSRRYDLAHTACLPAR